jgi:hypothetical protein
MKKEIGGSKSGSDRSWQRRDGKMRQHGPELHFLVPAVLISAYSNTKGEPGEKEAKIKKARQRAEKILGGFCGFYGNCGAGRWALVYS